MTALLRAASRATVARPALLRQQVRSVHYENKVDHTVPGGSANKAAFTVRFLLWAGVGSLLPFAACKISLDKAAGNS